MLAPVFLFIASSVVFAESAGPGIPQAQGDLAEINKAIAANPKDFTAYNRLAVTLLTRAAETWDTADIVAAQEAVDKSLVISPNNFEGKRAQATIWLDRNEFSKALTLARALNKKTPDDVLTYGVLSRAYAELGQYKEAETQGQWMLNLQPGNRPALLNAAWLREVFGDLPGSLELLNLAFQSTSTTEAHARAAILVNMAHVRLLSGHADEAAHFLDEALTLVPNDVSAWAEKARVELVRKNYEGAIELMRRVNEAAPSASASYGLGFALQASGKPEDARKAFAEFLSRSSAQPWPPEHWSRDLILYYAGPGKDAAKAVALARDQAAERQDVYTLDAYAWALHVNGDESGARAQMDKALAVGVADPEVLAHSAAIGKTASVSTH